MKTAILTASVFLSGLSMLQAQTSEQIIGCWKMPSRAGETLQFMRNGSFNFHDYNAKSRQFEYLYGNYQTSAGSLTLLYDDRPKQTFSVTKDKYGNWMLSKAGGFRFVKAEASECTVD